MTRSCSRNGVWIVSCGLAVLCLVVAHGNAAAQPSPPKLDKKLLDDLPPASQLPTPPKNVPADDGEDLGQQSEEHPLQAIAERMREARRLLAADGAAAQAISAQQQAADDLAALIEALRRRQQQQPNDAAAQAQASATATPQAQQTTSQDTAAGSTNGESPPNVAVGRNIWGHLPSRVREQIQSSVIEEFLPQYEELIEAYYRRLAEE